MSKLNPKQKMERVELQLQCPNGHKFKAGIGGNFETVTIICEKCREEITLTKEETMV